MAELTALQLEGTSRLRGNRLFLLAAFLVPVLFLAIVGAALHMAAERGPVQYTSGSAQAIYFWAKKKDAIARATTGSRILLFGGSSVLYGIRAQTLASDLNTPVVNMGLHAGLGLDYIFYRAKSELHRGDTAVLFLEYGMYVKDYDWTLADYVIPFDLDYLRRAEHSKVGELIGKITPSEYAQKIRGGLFGTPEAGTRILDAINSAGDFVANRRSNQKDFQVKAVVAARPTVGTSLSANQMAQIAAFLDWCRDNGVRVLAAFPPIVDRPEYHSPERQAFFDAVKDWFDQRGIQRLGEPQEFMLDPEMFFDSAYHLHDEGAGIVTAIVIERFKGITR